MKGGNWLGCVAYSTLCRGRSPAHQVARSQGWGIRSAPKTAHRGADCTFLGTLEENRRMATACLVRIDHCRCRAALKSRHGHRANPCSLPQEIQKHQRPSRIARCSQFSRDDSPRRSTQATSTASSARSRIPENAVRVRCLGALQSCPGFFPRQRHRPSRFPLYSRRQDERIDYILTTSSDRRILIPHGRTMVREFS